MRVALALLLLPLLAPAAAAQRQVYTYPRHAEATDVPASARYQLIQSPTVASGMFRLDRFSGQTSTLTVPGDSTLAWQDIPRRPHPAGDPAPANTVNYQVFISGFGLRYTFLMNVHSGAVWQLSEAGPGRWAWTPVP